MMLFKYIFDYMYKYLLVSIFGLILMISFYEFFYRIIYKKLLKGKKDINSLKLLSSILLVISFLFIIYVTCLDHFPCGGRVSNLIPFFSYRQAMFDYSVITVSQLVFNIILFIPIGLLLPLCNDRFKKAVLTILVGFILTVGVETAQYVFAIGVFDVDDIISNVLGTILGYSISTTCIGVIDKEKRTAGYILFHIWPFCTIILVFVGFYTNYLSRDYGNLISPEQVIDMSDVSLELSVYLKSTESEMPLYYPTTYTKSEADDFVNSIFKNLYGNNYTVRNKNYDTEQMYYSNDCFIHFNRQNGKFTFSRSSSHDDEFQMLSASSEQLNSYINSIGIILPNNIELFEVETGKFKGSFDMYREGNTIIDGVVELEYYSDNTVKSINKDMAEYIIGNPKKIISEYDAYLELKKGNFLVESGRNSLKNKKNIMIKSVEIVYVEDTKEFLHPVYKFYCVSDDTELYLLVDALKIQSNTIN